MKKGSHFTEESKQKIREGHLGKHHTEETKQKQREAHLGKKFTEEHKQHLSESHLGIPAAKGWHHSEKTKQKMRKPQSEEHKQHIIEAKLKYYKEHPGFGVGERNPMYGIKAEDNPMYGKKGKNHPHWKGGEEASNARSEKKRRGFGFVSLNDKFIGAEAHHLDKKLVLYIPKELHHSVYHNLHTGQGMEEINNLACEYVYGILQTR